MSNQMAVWQSLSPFKRGMAALSALVAMIVILVLGQAGGRTEKALLYAGLDPRAAGEVITSLDQAGAAYEIRGDAIYVDLPLRDQLRMQLAGQGIPSPGGAGYELLDGLSGFGTTSQMFDTAYWRAKEGELARTILAMPQVRSARVHISQTNNAFMRDRGRSASVTVGLAGGPISAAQANALRYLVAGATGNMLAQDVSVIDTVGGLVAPPDAKSQRSSDEKSLEIKRNVERLLFARVGADRAVVEVSVDVVTEREAITERVFDPQGRVAVSSENQQKSEQNNDTESSVTVASNLPEGDAGGAGKQSQSNESRERVNFEVSNTHREILREPGAIRRMTVAVLVDGVHGDAEDGNRSWQPRSDVELAALRELVASAAGIDESRGDVLTIKSLEFLTLPDAESHADIGSIPLLDGYDSATLARIFVMATVVIAVLFLVIRSLLIKRNEQAALLEPNGVLNLEEANFSGLDGSSLPSDFNLPDLPMIEFDENGMVHDEPVDPVSKLRRLMGERQAESVEILRGWMEMEEERR